MSFVTSICIILIGLLVSLVFPKWIKFGTKKTRGKYQFYLNIIGLVIILIGVVSLYQAIKGLFA
ncbi:hypothetical protein [uncultured Bacteroides sp.]|uniref:hypothetical protein n=1 Tax=uncultured Bacteroides sp. TaxID=162156 RepID=UPI0026313568|nr:hypothetical protein [uncultured Bacteroides sp.]